MRYLVTGGCGFIGSHLVDALLHDGHEVTVLDDLSTGHRENLASGARLIKGDVRDFAVVAAAMAGMHGCFHLAAIASVQLSTRDWSATHRINQTGSVNVFEAARNSGPVRPLPVVFASSAAVYGDCSVMPVTEECAALPISPYGADKLGSELHGRAAATVFASRVIGLRLFNVFGPRQCPKSTYSGVISIFMDRAFAGQSLSVLGDGEQTRDFVFISDAVRAFQLSMAWLMGQDGAYFGAFNVCRGDSLSINRLAVAVREACRSEVDIVHGAFQPGDIRASLGCPARACREIGFKAEIPLTDGLSMTADWYRLKRQQRFA